MFLYLLIFFTGLLVVSFSIPSIIYIAFRKRLFDVPTEERKIHTKIIPNLGGISIFTGVLFSTSLFIQSSVLPNAGLILAAGIILFIVGLKDDLVGLSPLKKFGAQILAGLILAILANIRINSFHGMLGIDEISYPLSVGLTVFAVVGIVNAFNLIDGIDGLAGSLGVVISLSYAVLFYIIGNPGWSYMAIALAGSLLGFLFYNISPAKIFMGDTGSLLVGMFVAIFSIKFADYNSENLLVVNGYMLKSPLALTVAILIVPLFDTMRVFTLRILNSDSPFKADRNHMHHRLIDLNLSHTVSTMILVGVSLAFFTVALILQNIGNVQLLITLVMMALLCNSLLTIYIGQRKRKLAEEKEIILQQSTQKVVEKERFIESVLKQITKD